MQGMTWRCLVAGEMKEPRGVSGWGDGIRPRGEPVNTLLLGTAALGSHCTPMSGFRTASTLAHMLEMALRCLQEKKPPQPPG